MDGYSFVIIRRAPATLAALSLTIATILLIPTLQIISFITFDKYSAVCEFLERSSSCNRYSFLDGVSKINAHKLFPRGSVQPSRANKNIWIVIFLIKYFEAIIEIIDLPIVKLDSFSNSLLTRALTLDNSASNKVPFSTRHEGGSYPGSSTFIMSINQGLSVVLKGMLHIT
ncbi:hypothetical protein RirG_255410 [Rhizophagus irregularis DAOM 197198w]|uniref:Uncharacterized protein n=1 Tax=Rhizophagus irregularis (strain DAOM 197198w) TaxID=1432141 RepID=A0A015JB95_RHIIW|nr:hypothetical protein RirG_255410 [Rhizophagus irregularis DAOM 197198w]